MSASYVFSPSGHMTARYRLLYPSMEGLKMKWMARRERGGGRWRFGSDQVSAEVL